MIRFRKPIVATRLGRLYRRAFTLVELLVVMVIIGILAGLVAFKTRSYLIASKQHAAQAEIATICQALETFYATHDRYPTNEEGLELLVSGTPKFPGGILTKLPRDPWGQPYQYNSPGRTEPYEIVCYGADHREGGTGADADLSSVELETVK